MAEIPKGRVDVEDAHGNMSDLVAPDQIKTEALTGDPNADEIFKLVHLAVQENISIHSGPLPSPDTLEKYEQVLPGLADRIVSTAEGESSHRRNMETKQQQSTHRFQAIGQLSGIAIVFATLALVFFEKTGATTVASTALLSLAGVFVFAKLRVRRKHDVGLPSSEELHQ